MKQHWIFRDELTMTSMKTMKVKWVIILAATHQPHRHLNGKAAVERIDILVNMSTGVENNCKKLFNMPCLLTDMVQKQFHLIYMASHWKWLEHICLALIKVSFHCIADYCRKFPIVKLANRNYQLTGLIQFL